MAGHTSEFLSRLTFLEAVVPRSFYALASKDAQVIRMRVRKKPSRTHAKRVRSRARSASAIPQVHPYGCGSVSLRLRPGRSGRERFLQLSGLRRIASSQNQQKEFS